MDVHQYIQKLNNSGHKSTVLMPLTWLIVVLIIAMTTSFINAIPIWIPVIFFALAILVIVVFLICYVYCFFKNPDLIRSEKYATTKMLIESGLFGDNEKMVDETEEQNIELISENNKIGSSE